MKTLHVAIKIQVKLTNKKKLYLGLHHFFHSFLSIHETFWNSTGRKDFISLSELLEENPVGETLSTDSNTFQNTITSQLL